MIVNEAAAALESFEQAFRSRVHGCVRDCACGRIYYNPDERSWTWEDGELDRLRKNPNATASVYAVGTVEFEGRIYADACDCWKERAARIVEWLRTHDDQIAEFLNLEKKRRAAAAKSAAVVS